MFGSTVIHNLLSASFVKGEICYLVKKIRELAGRFIECRWSHVRRSANRAADYVANC